MCRGRTCLEGFCDFLSSFCDLLTCCFCCCPDPCSCCRCRGRRDNLDDLLPGPENEYTQVHPSQTWEFNPQKSHIKQGMIGDCWLLSTLGKLCDSDVEALKSCFVNHDTWQTSNENLHFKFHVVELEANWLNTKITAKSLGFIDIYIGPEILTHSGEHVGSGYNSVSENNWVNFFEKAFAKFLSNGYVKVKPFSWSPWLRIQGFNSKQYKTASEQNLLHGGVSCISHTAITGKKSTTNLNILCDGTDGPLSNNTFFETSTVCRCDTLEIKDIMGQKHGLPRGHAYSARYILQGGMECVEIFNPWNRIDDNFIVAKTDFQEKFSGYTIPS